MSELGLPLSPIYQEQGDKVKTPYNLISPHISKSALLIKKMYDSYEQSTDEWQCVLAPVLCHIQLSLQSSILASAKQFQFFTVYALIGIKG